MNNTLLTILLVFVAINCVTNVTLMVAIYDFNQNVVAPAHQMGTGLVAIKDTMKLFMPSISIVERAYNIFSYIKATDVIGSAITYFKNSTSA